MKTFDYKNFNGEVFLAYTKRIEDPVKTSLIQSGVLRGEPELVSLFPAQVGGNYAVRPITGLLSGDAVDLDGNTDIDDGVLKTLSQGIVCINKGKSFTEKDFTYSLSGKDFMVEVGEQVGHYWAKENQKVMLSILKGIFASAISASIIEKSAVSSSDIIDAVRGVGGDNADLFKVCFMHSYIAMKLEKANQLTFVLKNDANGMARPTNIAYWGARLVIVNDQCPMTLSYAKTTDVALTAGKTYYTKAGDVYTAVSSPDVAQIANYYERSHEYITYVLGERALTFQELPVLVPAEMARDAKDDGGKTSLVSRERFALAPEGLSFKASAVTSASNKISNAVLENGSNWEIVGTAESIAIEKKNIPFCAIKYVLNDYAEAHPQA